MEPEALDENQLAFFDIVQESADPAVDCSIGVIEAAEEHDLPIVVLGSGELGEAITDLLLSEGERFLYTDNLAYLPPAIYIATDERYRSYQYPPGSVVVDPLGLVPDIAGVAIKRLTYRT